MLQVEFDESLSVCFDRPIHRPLGQTEILQPHDAGLARQGIAELEAVAGRSPWTGQASGRQG